MGELTEAVVERALRWDHPELTESSYTITSLVIDLFLKNKNKYKYREE